MGKAGGGGEGGGPRPGRTYLRGEVGGEGDSTTDGEVTGEKDLPAGEETEEGARQPGPIL